MSIYRQQTKLGSTESAAEPTDFFAKSWQEQLGDYGRQGITRHNRIIERRRSE